MLSEGKHPTKNKGLWYTPNMGCPWLFTHGEDEYYWDFLPWKTVRIAPWSWNAYRDEQLEGGAAYVAPSQLMELEDD